MKKAKRGFTLIELLVVMAIIAVLATLVIAAINTARKGSRDTQRRSNVKAIQAGLEAYAATQQGKYPLKTTAQDLDAIVGSSTTKGFLYSYISNADSITDPNGNANNKGRYCYTSGTGTTAAASYTLRFVSENTDGKDAGTFSSDCKTYTGTSGHTYNSSTDTGGVEDFSVQ